MKIFNLKLFCEIGIIKDVIKEVILEGEILNEYEVVKDFMFKKVEEIGLKRV